MPLTAASQVAPAAGSRSADQGEPSYKYEAYVGYSYTGLNQVNESRHGLQGVDASVTRDWGKYFGLTAEGSYYKWAIANPIVIGSNVVPTVSSVMFGPAFHANLYGKVGGFAHVLLGGEHTGGEKQTPNISFAGGVGGGAEYQLTQRISLRVSGDYIAASFSVAGNSPALGYSAHKTWNPHAGFGAVYRF
jgi:hypothetical protein